MLRSWMLSGLGGLLVASSVWAGPGTVKTRDGQVFTGDITEDGNQVLVDRKGIKTSIDRKEVQTITYANSIEQECRRRLALLSPADVNGRIQLAQWLFESKAYGLAITVLNDARQIQPHNPDVFALMRTVDQQVALQEREARKHGPVQLASADRTAAAIPAAADTKATAAGGPRLLTPEEMNQVRQAEWQEGQPVRVRFADDVRRKYIQYKQLSQPEIAEFNRRTPPQQAWGILNYGTEDMKKDVILSDPPAITQYKLVQRAIITGCANCHSQDKPAGNFALRTPVEPEADSYTNFLILQKYTQKSGGKTYRMIDRDHPEESLLIRYALPPTDTAPSHPKSANYRGVVHMANDSRLQKTQAWISSLKIPAPDYSSIDIGVESGAPAGETQKQQPKPQ